MLANFIYLVALAAVSPFVLYRMVRHGRYRRGIRQKLFGLSAAEAKSLLRRDDGIVGHSCVWFHAVSVGEVNLLPRVVRQFKAQNPGVTVVVSTSTDTGYDLAIDRFGTEHVFFCPLDFTWAVSRTLQQLNPETLVLAELELWPNLIRQAALRGCRVTVMNARMSDRSSSRYQQFAAITRPVFQGLDWIGSQDAHSATNFIACGAPAANVQVTGSLKFDDAPVARDSVDVQNCSQWAGVDPWHKVWCVGSTQPGEEEMAVRIYDELSDSHPELRLIIVPRHVERFEQVAKLIDQSGYRCHRRTCDESLLQDVWANDQIILIDTIGELRSWWGVCQIATVGGSFTNRGGQNMLEPAGYGAAVSFGPDTRNFKSIANALLECQGAVRVANEIELKAFVQRCLVETPAADSLGRSAKRLIESQRGATAKTLDAINQTIQRESKVADKAA